MWITISILFMILSMVLSILLFYSLRRINKYENLILQFQKIITFDTEKILKDIMNQTMKQVSFLNN